MPGRTSSRVAEDDASGGQGRGGEGQGAKTHVITSVMKVAYGGNQTRLAAWGGKIVKWTGGFNSFSMAVVVRGQALEVPQLQLRAGN